MLHYEQVFGNVFERRENTYCVVLLMKYRRKIKGEQVINLKMAQQLKIENLSVCQDNYFVRDRLTVLMIKINFNLLQILTMNSLNVKHQGKSSNQLAFHLSAYTHL